ncbi:hypothetical protein DNTS_017154 [Danionella cerebrum]|uniref:Uncharacterized protein n=1 Tax=Danionella cerebrum TaxID=2873325 RepID=A0A553NGB8_9TELE|nr:hypothetical protein DNTS_017154 [Danionella translucida]
MNGFKMTSVSKTLHTKVWIAIKRLDLSDNRVTALREIHIPSGANVANIEQILAHSFRFDASQKTLKVRNNRGSLIPLNSSMPPNSKQMPYLLEVAKNYQHVNPRPRSIPLTVLNNTMKLRLQSILKRIERLEELSPQIKLQRQEKMTKDIELLNQKLTFLHRRMQTAESYSWEGMLRRAPLW